MTYDLKVS